MMRLNADNFRRLYIEHGPRALGFFLRMTGYDQELARDLTQDLFMRLWARRDSYDFDKPFRTWMFAVANNMLKNEYRHKTVVMEYADSLDDNEPTTESNVIERQELSQMIQDAVQRLPQQQKAVFMLRYEEELKVSEIAKICDIPEGTVKSRLYSALTAVRNYCKTNE